MYMTTMKTTAATTQANAVRLQASIGETPAMPAKTITPPAIGSKKSPTGKTEPDVK